MTIIKSDHANGRKAMPQPAGSEVVNVMLVLAILAAETASGDLYHMGDLPEDCAFVDAVFEATDLDTGTPAIILAFGVINDAEDDLDVTLEAGIDLAQAGGVARVTLTSALLALVTPGNARKKLGFKVTTASATGADGTVKTSLSYRASAYGA